MKKIYIIPFFALFLLGTGQTKMAESKPMPVKVVETNEQTTAIGEAILRANQAEADEALAFQRLDSIRIATSN